MILVNQFWDFDKQEKSDIYDTLLKNCMNKHIKKIIVFIVGNTNVVLKHPKIQKVYVNKFLTTKKMIYDYLVYDDVYLISNNQVKFGSSILNFYRLDFEEENPININGTIVYKRRNNIQTDEIVEIDFKYKGKTEKPKRKKRHKPVIKTKIDDSYNPKSKEEDHKPKIKKDTQDLNKKPKKVTKYKEPKKRIIRDKDKTPVNPEPKPRVRKPRIIENINRRKKSNIKQSRDSNNRVAIVLHLYYQDLWFYFKERLENLDYNYDLYVTLNESSTVGQTEWMKNKIENFGGKVYILPNKGLDIGPFLYVMNLLFTKNKKYDYLIKLHSKKSIHNNIGDSWRNSLVDSLIGSDKILKDNIHKMNKDNKIGMLGSKEWILNDNQNYDNKYVQYYKDKLSIKTRDTRFVGGTMFMVDFKTIKMYFENRTMSIYDELEEGYFQDHTEPKKTHSLERIFGSIVYDDNKVIG